MHTEPINPPTRAYPSMSAPSRVEVTKVNGSFADVRNIASRGARSRVPIVVGLTLAPGDRALLEHVDSDPNLPVLTAKLPAGAYA